MSIRTEGSVFVDKSLIYIKMSKKAKNFSKMVQFALSRTFSSNTWLLQVKKLGSKDLVTLVEETALSDSGRVIGQ